MKRKLPIPAGLILLFALYAPQALSQTTTNLTVNATFAGDGCTFTITGHFTAPFSWATIEGALQSASFDAGQGPGEGTPPAPGTLSETVTSGPAAFDSVPCLGTEQESGTGSIDFYNNGSQGIVEMLDITGICFHWMTTQVTASGLTGTTPHPTDYCSDYSTEGTITITVGTSSSPTSPSPLSITTNSLSAGTAEQAYGPVQLAATGGTAPYSWSGSSLPPGMQLTSGGLLEGTPTSSGTYKVAITVTDNGNPKQTATTTLSLTIAAATVPSLQITTASPLPSATALAQYGPLQIQATGGTSPYSWTWSGGPPGMQFSPAGVLQGTPTTDATYQLVIKVSDSGNPQQTATKTLTLTVSGSLPTLTITTSQLSGAVVNKSYGPVQLAASGGIPTYAWAVTEGQLPTGMQLTESGVLDGTPTQAGSFTFTVAVKDSESPAAEATKTLTLVVTKENLQFTTDANLPGGTVTLPYNDGGVNLAVSGAAGPVSFEVTEAALPPGLALSSSGLISGTPTQSGSYGFTVTATDTSDGLTVSQAFNLVVGGPLAITMPPPDNLSLGNLCAPPTPANQGTCEAGPQLPYSFTANGGTPPYSWTMTEVPYGLQLGDCVGIDTPCVLSGTPSADKNVLNTPGALYFSVLTVTDSTGATATVTVSSYVEIDVTPPAMMGGSKAQTAYVGLQYQFDFGQLITGGLPPYSCTPVSGQNSIPGVTMTIYNGDCTLAGTPTTPGTYPVVVQVNDSSTPNLTANYTLTLTVAQPQSSASATPVIFVGGIINPYSGQVGITPGGIIGVYGNTLTDTSYSASSVPLPTTLGGVQVSVNGQNVPIYYASPGLINFQAPLNPAAYYPPGVQCLLTPSGPAVYYPVNCPAPQSVSVTIIRNGVPSAAVSVAVVPSAPAILTYTRVAGSTDPVIVNASNNSQLVTPTAAAKGGDIIVAYGTGIGFPACAVDSGQASTANCLATIVPQITFPDYPALNSALTIAYAGMTPTLVGLAQFNIQLPATFPAAAIASGSIRMRIGDPTTGQTFNLYLYSPIPPLTTQGTVILPIGAVGTAYSATLSATGGTPPYRWSLSSGTLPAGLTLNASTGVISGTPTAATASAATFIFNVTDSGTPAQSAVLNATLAVNASPFSVTTLTPSSASAGSGPLTITITGSGFTSGAQVFFSSSSTGGPQGGVNATVLNSTTLTAQLPASFFVNPATVQIQVVTANGFSNALTFTITAAATPPVAPSINNLNPSSAQAGSGPLTVAITGSGFTNGATAQWNGSPLSTTFVSASALTAQISASDLSAQGSAQIIVVDPNGSESSSVAFTITAPTPQGGIISTVAGNGTAGFSGDNGPATAAGLNAPRGAALDAAGNLYIADTSNHRIRKVSTSGTITTVAGNGTAGFSGDGGAATSAELNSPGGVAVDTAGNLYVADTSNQRIRKVATNGTITTIAGNGTTGFSGDNGPATAAGLSTPRGVAVDASGNLYIADTVDQRIRKVSASGTISTVAGNGVAGFSGDGGPATAAEFSYPDNVTVDASGNLYIADFNNARIRKVSAGGTITTAAGSGSGAFFGDGGLATSAGLFLPSGVTVDASGNLYIADTVDARIRKVTAATGIITTIAGNEAGGFSGDGGPATSAGLYGPTFVAVDASGDLYIADTGNNRIRYVSASAAP